jgi:hypothetical protein
LPAGRFHSSARERTSAGFIQAALSVSGAVSLSASLRLLLSVNAVRYVSMCPIMGPKALFVKRGAYPGKFIGAGVLTAGLVLVGLG